MSANQQTSNKQLKPRLRSRQLQSKLRSSCDACGQAKIKCDRGQPTCGRCAAQGVSCVYGISRKGGKPPRRRPAASSSLQLPSCLPSRPSELETTRSIGPGCAGGLGCVSNLDGMDMDMDMDAMFGIGDSATAIDSPFFASDAALQTWLPYDTFSSLDSLPPSSSDWDAFTSRQNGSALEPVEIPATLSTSASKSSGSASTSLSTTPLTAPQPPSPPPPLRHDCTQEANDIMRRLYCANPSAPISEGLPARTLDLSSVLTRTGDVVGPLGQLLECPCARSSHMSMLYASIISRILLWYRQAACNASPDRVSSASPSATTATLATQEALSSFTSSALPKTFDAEATGDDGGVSVPLMPVMVGNFRSDDRNVQSALVNCLILSELRRVGGLIDTFTSLGTIDPGLQAANHACPAADDPCAGVADVSLFTSLGSWLRTEHGNTVKQAKSGLSVLG